MAAVPSCWTWLLPGHELEEVAGRDRRGPPHHRTEARCACHGQQRAQKEVVGVVERVGGRRRRELLLRRRELLDVVVGAALDRPPRREPVDQAKQFVVVAERVLVESVDERTAVRGDRQPPLAVEGDDRLPHRDATHPELLGDLVLANPVALTQLAVEDQGADVDGDELTAAAPVHEGDGREGVPALADDLGLLRRHAV